MTAAAIGSEWERFDYMRPSSDPFQIAFSAFFGFE
jgi:hypothetical protein